MKAKQHVRGPNTDRFQRGADWGVFDENSVNNEKWMGFPGKM